MNPVRLTNIFNKVTSKYEGKPREIVKELILEDLSSVCRGLSKTEDFLSQVDVLTKERLILIHKIEDLPWIGLLPYLHKELQGNKCSTPESMYLIYFVNDSGAYLWTSICFIDLFKYSNDKYGFDGTVQDIQSLGLYFPKTNDFISVKDL